MTALTGAAFRRVREARPAFARPPRDADYVDACLTIDRVEPTALPVAQGPISVCGPDRTDADSEDRVRWVVYDRFDARE
jgi:hypothetical protein